MKGPTLYELVADYDTGKPTVVRARKDSGELIPLWIAACDNGHSWDRDECPTHAEALVAAIAHAATHQEDR